LSFFGEIKRRRVFQVAIVYAVVAWALVQIVDVLNDPLSLPGWLDTVVVVLLAVGFPIAIILAWAFDLTPAGVVRTSSSDESDTPATPATAASAETTPAIPEILRNSVAVLPLDNLSPNPDDAYFAAGIHEEILNSVAKIKDINVIARTSVKRYAGSDKPIAEIAQELGVGTIMEGSVRYAGERVRVTAQLIDAATENHLWSEVYERGLADVFAIQADIAEKIAAALAAELSAAEKENIEKLPTNSPEAYALYLRAAAVLQDKEHHIGSSPELRATVESLLEQTLAADPDFALAYVRRANIFSSTLNQDPGTQEDSADRRSELEGRALADLEKALRLDPGIGAAYDGLARIHQFNWRGKEALAAYERAVELAPSDPIVLINFAVFCAVIGRHTKARELAGRAIALNPNSGPVQNWVFYINIQIGDFGAALITVRRAAELLPAFGLPHVVLGQLERMSGNDDEAIRNTRLAEQLMHDEINPAFLGELIYSYGMLGQRDDARRVFSRFGKMAESRRIPTAPWALAHLGVRNRDEALHWLERTADDPEPYVSYFTLMNMKANGYRDPMLDEPEFVEIRERLGYPALTE